MAYYINPKRLRAKRGFIKSIGFFVTRMLCKPLLSLGFKHVEYYYVHGEGSGNTLTLGSNVSTLDAVFNLSSGNISVGNHTLFSHNVHVLTGFHRFYNGTLAKLQENSPKEVPDSGYDIIIGSGCFIGANAIILKGVTIGDNTIIGAGSVVTKDIPSNVFAAGVPAIVIGANS
jgi:galactoside O-acetyltransferase